MTALFRGLRLPGFLYNFTIIILWLPPRWVQILVFVLLSSILLRIVPQHTFTQYWSKIRKSCLFFKPLRFPHFISFSFSLSIHIRDAFFSLLSGFVSQGLGTTKFMNLIGWKGYWPRPRFSHLDRLPDRNVLKWKSSKLKCKIIDCFHLTIFNSGTGEKLMREKK